MSCVNLSSLIRTVRENANPICRECPHRVTKINVATICKNSGSLYSPLCARCIPNLTNINPNGLTAHNLPLHHVRNAGLSVCCGGIIGLGESTDDRIDLLHTLATLPKPPESVPINALVAVPGTPLEEQQRVATFELVRMIAVARILMPESNVRLSAGRLEMSAEEQALCFLAGANSIFAGDQLLTTPNPEFDQDMSMFESLGLRAKAPQPVAADLADNAFRSGEAHL